MGSRYLASISLKGYEVVWQREPCSSNSLNCGDESACLRCWLTVWHIGLNVKWRGGLSYNVNVAKLPFLSFNVISILIRLKVNSYPCQLGNEIGQVCWCLGNFLFDKVVHL